MREPVSSHFSALRWRAAGRVPRWRAGRWGLLGMLAMLASGGTAGWSPALGQTPGPPAAESLLPPLTGPRDTSETFTAAPLSLSEPQADLQPLPLPDDARLFPEHLAYPAVPELSPPDAYTEPPGEPLGEPLAADQLDELVEEFPEYFYQGAGADQGPSWLVGNGNRMGLFTLAFRNHREFKIPDRYLTFDWAVHFVSGPRQTDLPPRLYDLRLRWGRNGLITDQLGYDLHFSLGFFSDFEGSARKGFRCPSTAVLYYREDDCRQWLLGADLLNRDDFWVLPVIGMVWTPRLDLRMELVFPRPRVAIRTPHAHWLYLAGEMGGGMWAVERQSGADDVVTYRDLRVVFGFQDAADADSRWFTQLGIAFERQLEFRSGSGDYAPWPTAIWQGMIVY